MSQPVVTGTSAEQQWLHIHKIDKAVFRELKYESTLLEENPDAFKFVKTGLTSLGVPDSYNTTTRCQDLIQHYLNVVLEEYINAFPTVQSKYNMLSGNTGLRLNHQWWNLMKPNQFIPCHVHDGVLSFTIWTKLPAQEEDKYNGVIEFQSPTVFGLNSSRITLTEEHEGYMAIFPSVLMHCVYPYYQNNTRISLSGNLVFDAYCEGSHSFNTTNGE